MADEKVGIVIAAQDAATAVLQGIGTSAKDAAGDLQKMGKVGSSAFSAMGTAMTGLNQGLEIAKKGMELFKMAVVETVKKALEFRKQNDASRKTFEQLNKAAQIFRARVGDAIIPVLVGITKGFMPVLKSMTEWINKNRQLIATNLVNWLNGVANALTTGIVQGVLLASKAFAGWNLIIESIKLGINKFFEIAVEGTNNFLGSIKAVAGSVGLDSLVKKIEALKEPLTDMENDFYNAGEASKESIKSTIEDMEAFESKVRSVETTVRDGFGATVKATFEEIRASEEGMNITLEEQKAKQAERKAAAEAEHAAKLARMEAERLAFEEGMQRMLESQQAMEAETQATYERIGGFVGNVITQIGTGMVNALFTALETGQSFGKIMKGVMKGILKTVINTLVQIGIKQLIGLAVQSAMNKATIISQSLVAGASAFAATAAIPIVGPALAPGAAAAATGSVAAMAASLQFGGLVTGGLPGSDRVPALLAPKERVLNERETREYEGLKAGEGGGTGQGVNITLSTNVSFETIPDETETIRYLNDTWEPAMIDLISNENSAFLTELRKVI